MGLLPPPPQKRQVPKHFTKVDGLIASTPTKAPQVGHVESCSICWGSPQSIATENFAHLCSSRHVKTVQDSEVGLPHCADAQGAELWGCGDITGDSWRMGQLAVVRAFISQKHGLI